MMRKALLMCLLLIVACTAENPQVVSPAASPDVLVGGGDEPRDAPPVEPPAVPAIDPTTAPPAAQGISRASLREHSTEDDCWVAFEGKVYDITAYLQEHPGGTKNIIPVCGTADEFAQAFEDSKHGTSKLNVLQQKGVLKGSLTNG